MTNRTATRRATAALILVLAIGAHLTLLDRGHHGDTAVFRDWWLATRSHPFMLYRTPADVNYPLLGALLSTAPGFLGFGQSDASFHRGEKLLLLPWALLFALALQRAHRALGDERATWAWSVLLPAGWAGSLYFGQLDGACMALQAGAAWAGARALVRRELGALALGVLALQASVLVKQLALFAYPALFALFVLAALASAAPRRALVATLLSPLLLALPDAFVALPRGLHFHLLYVLTDAGPPHGRMIGNGPGIWSFLDWPADTSSSDVFALGCSPRLVGTTLALLFALGVAAFTWRALRARAAALDRAALLIFSGGLLHLGLVALLAGSHERYCLTAFPLLALGASRLAPRLARWILVVASVCGLYVLSTIEFDGFAFFPPMRHPAFAASFVLPLLIALASRLVARYRPTP